MEIILGKMAGFCPGVENAVKKTQNIVNINLLILIDIT